MFTMRQHRSNPMDFRGAVIGSVVACFALLACLVVADALFWPGKSAGNGSYQYGQGSLAFRILII